MELDRKFEIATSFPSVSLGSLEIDCAYHIVRAVRINMRYGDSVLVGITDSTTSSVKVFLPKRYGDVVSNEDSEAINIQYTTRGPTSGLQGDVFEI